jgi:Restriction endonuclease
MEVFVTKADGSKQLFDKEKVARTCMRMGASRNLAFAVAEKVESRVYDGIPTAKILELIFRFMRKGKPGVKHLFDLRRGLSLMDSKPEFEIFVRVLLEHNGFEVTPNQILKGRCVEHEVDAIARKNGITYFVEAKHHLSYHALTGLDESRIARAILEDISEGYKMGTNDFKVDKAVIITNTRYSEHAIRYGLCRDIVQIGWNYPVNQGLEKTIEEKRLHPLSCLRGLRREDRLKFVKNGLVLIKQIIAEDKWVLARKTGLRSETIEDVVEEAQHSANTLEY